VALNVETQLRILAHRGHAVLIVKAAIIAGVISFASLNGAAQKLERPATTDKFIDFTFDHEQERSRTRWRIPEAYASPYIDWRQTNEPKKIFVLDAALPDLRPWATSGLNLRREEDYKRYVSITVTPSYDFAIEKRTIPRLLKDELQVVGDYSQDLVQYRKIRRDSRGEVQVVPVSWFYLLPKQQSVGRAVYFECVRHCTASTDFSAVVAIEYRFDRNLLSSWRDIDQQVRDLLAQFIL
jgi:hypothetical protein